MTPYVPGTSLTAAENAEREWNHIRLHADPADFYAAVNRVAGLPDDAGEHDRSQASRGRSPYDRRFNAEAHVAAYRQVVADRETGAEPNLCTPDAMTVTWGDERRSFTETIRKSVDLTGAPPITVAPARGSKVHGGAYSPYSITLTFTRFGPAEAWRAEIVIYAMRHGDNFGSHFSPDRVVGMPLWLADLIDNATPKENS
ncbi:hypothetical protein ABT369_39425 [Dactylosporangium sp. NPDC000244]|uniref:hypothetical protein n=1 Tax=Dactylosporangium sp. NPDC000244 TaxID=3154365 RepID=UPI0033277DA2